MSRFWSVFVLYMAVIMIGPSMATRQAQSWALRSSQHHPRISPMPSRSILMVARQTRVFSDPGERLFNQAKPYIVQKGELANSFPCRTSHATRTLYYLRGGGFGQVLDIDELVGDAYDWCNNLGAPAALVAGAVLATLYENFRGGQLELHKGDTRYIMVAKKLTNMLLLSAFAMQIVSIFVTTVMGSVLRSYDYSSTKSKATSGLGFLQEQYEFEFLTSRLSFLQGLLHWLAGVAIEYTIPRKGEGQAAKKMDHFIAISLATLIVLLLSFYNSHLSFYPNYFQMLLRWGHVTVIKYFETYQPLMILYIPGILLSCYSAFRALQETAYSEERDD